MDRDEEQELRQSLAALKLEHRRLDDEVSRLAAKIDADQLEISRLKKRKLTIKDEILRLEDRLLPDIIA
jgi:hypothetical protein